MMLELLSDIWRPLVEIIVMWFIIYRLFILFRGTGITQMVNVAFVLALVLFITRWLELNTINWVLTYLLSFSVIAFLILFQPELRIGLSHVGKNRIFGMLFKDQGMSKVIDALINASLVLAEKKIGALIAIERGADLTPYAESGISLDSDVSKELISTIFVPPTPLHDGGLIIRGGRIVAAGCLFPLTQNSHVSKMLGTRHRAAIGLTEQTDAVAIVVSEETGAISVAIRGGITRDLDRERFSRVVKGIFQKMEKKAMPAAVPPQQGRSLLAKLRKR